MWYLVESKHRQVLMILMIQIMMCGFFSACPIIIRVYDGETTLLEMNAGIDV